MPLPAAALLASYVLQSRRERREYSSLLPISPLQPLKAISHILPPSPLLSAVRSYFWAQVNKTFTADLMAAAARPSPLRWAKRTRLELVTTVTPGMKRGKCFTFPFDILFKSFFCALAGKCRMLSPNTNYLFVLSGPPVFPGPKIGRNCANCPCLIGLVWNVGGYRDR